ncbi:MAG: hypothetical protein MZW92_67350 [Comamonadaceae bacterium]|nr:hypothetical protein [Comamonadaceae bacterium]
MGSGSGSGSGSGWGGQRYEGGSGFIPRYSATGGGAGIGHATVSFLAAQGLGDVVGLSASAVKQWIVSGENPLHVDRRVLPRPESERRLLLLGRAPAHRPGHPEPALERRDQGRLHLLRQELPGGREHGASTACRSASSGTTCGIFSKPAWRRISAG